MSYLHRLQASTVHLVMVVTVVRLVSGLPAAKRTDATVVLEANILEVAQGAVLVVRPVSGLPAAKRTGATAVLLANTPLAVQAAVRIVQLGNTKV